MWQKLCKKKGKAVTAISPMEWFNSGFRYLAYLPSISASATFLKEFNPYPLSLKLLAVSYTRVWVRLQPQAFFFPA